MNSLFGLFHNQLLSCFPAYLRQFKSKSHIQGHPQKLENQSFHLTPSLMEFQTILLDTLALKRGARFFDPTCILNILALRAECSLVSERCPW